MFSVGHVKTYRILTLGASGSGKTIFLASMFNRLSVQRKGIGFFIQASEDQRKMLVNKFAKVEDPLANWPPGTMADEVSKWNFICVINSRKHNYPILKFSYLDYSGGIITDHVGDNIIEEKVNEADALLVLLDGQKLLYLMQGKKHTSLPSLHHDLRHILPVVAQVPSRPVHFVITKWDLLEGRYSLTYIRKMLMEDARFDFKAIVEQRSKLDIPMRLIPVSALGSGFAKLDEEGRMTKIANTAVKPFQVEIPIACVLIDDFKSAQNSPESHYIDPLLKILIILLNMFKIFGLASEQLISHLSLPVEYRISLAITNLLLNILHKGIENIDDLEDKQKTYLEAVRNKETAMESAIISYHLLMKKFEDQFPESDLS
jgi:hypothetical protein